MEAGYASDYVARTGFHTGHSSFQGRVVYSSLWNRRGDAWWLGLTGYAGGGLYSEEVDLYGGFTAATGRAAGYNVSYDELEPVLQVGTGDLMEIVPAHYWKLNDNWQMGVGMDWLQPITYFHGTAVPFVDVGYRQPLGRHLFEANAKIGYDGGGYGADVGMISIYAAELAWSLDRKGATTLRPFAGLFLPLSGSVNDRDIYFYFGLAFNQALAW